MIIASFVLCALLQETIDNPEYKGWTSYKEGSSVSYKMLRDASDFGGLQKVTLKSINDKELVLGTEFIKDGKTMGKPMERQVAAKVPADKAPKNVKEGEEDVEIGGKTLKCKTKEFEVTTSNGKVMQMKYWINGDIPGSLAKVQTSTEGGPKISMTAAEWEKK